MNRTPSGAPAGGEFATTSRTEPVVELLAEGDGGLVTAQHGSGAVISVYVGRDGAIVVDFDTSSLPAGQRVRVNVNDAAVYDGDPEVDECAGMTQPQLSVAECENAVSAAVLEKLPSATYWAVGTSEYDDGYSFSDTVSVTYLAPDGTVTAGELDVRGTVAADALGELSTFIDCGHRSVHTVTIVKES